MIKSALAAAAFLMASGCIALADPGCPPIALNDSLVQTYVVPCIPMAPVLDNTGVRCLNCPGSELYTDSAFSQPVCIERTYTTARRLVARRLRNGRCRAEYLATHHGPRAQAYAPPKDLAIPSLPVAPPLRRVPLAPGAPARTVPLHRAPEHAAASTVAPATPHLAAPAPMAAAPPVSAPPVAPHAAAPSGAKPKGP
jgi:hypothetical protein